MSIPVVLLSELKDSEIEDLISVLTSCTWPFHSTPVLEREKLLAQYKEGYFNGEGKRTFLIKYGIETVGVIRLFDLGENKEDDETPLFDIKIKSEYRGKGIGGDAVRKLVDLVFNEYPNKYRFDATTRADNTAMRRVFEKSGFVKEAHYRQAWPDREGNKYDCAGYSILRQDWKNKTITPVDWEK
ncbi:MAG: GNAT family N-acetyltransferase [Ignavibacteria bacterium]|nr:GNAT family N-acetyltransferase [Ignavibacteria bacterium]